MVFGQSGPNIPRKGTAMQSPTVKRALVSVSDKSGLAEFARGLVEAGVEVYSTGGTRKSLEGEGIPVRDVSEYTGFPEMMDGRLKTLHPKVFGGILCRHDNAEDMKALADHGILTFELVVVNLYPFEATVARPGVTLPEAIEKIDIGGPSLVRAAAKNHAFATIATSPSQYPAILEQIGPRGRRPRNSASGWPPRPSPTPPGTTGPSPRTSPRGRRKRVSRGRSACAITARRCSATAKIRTRRRPSTPTPRRPARTSSRPYNSTARTCRTTTTSTWTAPWRLSAASRSRPSRWSNTTTPAGRPWPATLADALRQGMAGDPLSAYGSVLGMNRVVDAATAEVLAEPGLFVEAIAAPDFSPQALEILTTRPKWKANVRLMKVGELAGPRPTWAYRFIDGGVLVQEADTLPDPQIRLEGRHRSQADRGPMGRSPLRLGDRAVRQVERHHLVQGPDALGHGGGPDEPRRFDGNRHQEGRSAVRPAR